MRRQNASRRGDLAGFSVGLVLALTLVTGCARGPRLRYAEVLEGPEEPRDVAALIREPKGECLEQAREVVETSADIYRAPLPARLHRGYAEVLRGLHPAAKQVLRRTGGVWFARRIPGSAARFVPCDAGDDRRGLILVDVSSNPLDDPTRDVEVPYRYWQLLGGPAAVHLAPVAGRDPDPAVRYVILHEIGHALSLLSGEFRLGDELQFELPSWEGFASFSWRPRLAGAVGSRLHDGGGVIPARLAVSEWRRVRRALNSTATWLAPGYREPSRLDADLACRMVDRLPNAGFVTPTAASAPTEDYAELFAHAILSAEGKMHPEDTVVVELPGCHAATLQAPYFSEGVGDKRRYIEHKLGL